MILYHSTYRTNLASIKKFGLGAKQIKNFDFSETGVICLTNDADVAYSFCESNDEIPEYKYNSGIIVLGVDTDTLDARYSGIDYNMRVSKDNDIEYYTYKKVINPRLLMVFTSKGFVGNLLELKRVPSYERN